MTRSRYSVASAALALGLAFALVPATAGLMDGFVREVGSTVLTQVGKALPPVPAARHGDQEGKTFAGCEQVFPNGSAILSAGADAVSPQWKPYALCSRSFAVLYSGLTKTPLVVVERLNRSQMEQASGEPRTDLFYPDERIPSRARAELNDYRGSGLHKGHMAPAANQPDRSAMNDSFALSNIVPQDPHNNQKVWSKVESDVRKYARRAQGNVYVFSGPIFKNEPRVIGRGKVWVPSHIYKLVHDASTERTWAYILPNTSDARIDAPMDYVTFVREFGWDLLARTPATVAGSR